MAHSLIQALVLAAEAEDERRAASPSYRPHYLGPVKFPPRLLEHPPVQDYITASEYRALLEELPPVIADLTLAAYETGERKGALEKWRFEQFDLERGIFHSTPEKRGEPTALPIPPALRVMITRRLQDRAVGGEAEGLVFHLKGYPLAEVNWYRDHWVPAWKALGKPHKRFHGLRVAYVTDSTAAGLDQAEVMKWTGHKRTETFRRYRATRTDQLAASRSRLDSYRAKLSKFTTGAKVRQLVEAPR